ncbi:MAG: hypothetical protein AB1451_08650 [Nitrospirota bacterium]
MRQYGMVLVAVLALAGLGAGCTDSDQGPRAASVAEDTLTKVSDELTPEESALVTAAEAEASSAGLADAMEHP